MRRRQHLRPVIDRTIRTAALVATAVAVPVVLAVAFLVGETGSGGTTPTRAATATPGPLRTSVPDIDQATARICDPVMQQMPVTLNDGSQQAPLQPLVVTPGGPSFLAWGDPLVTLQCGVARPAPLTSSSGYVPYTFGPNNAPGATWLVQPGGARDTWTVIDRQVYLRATIPHAAVGYLTDVSAVIGKALPAVCKGPVEAGDPPNEQYCGSRP